MSTPKLVEDFYQRIWNDGNLDAAADLLTPEFSFRGSLGRETPGREALADYRCEILSCVAEEDRAFSKMRFPGRQVASFSRLRAYGQNRALAGISVVPV